MPLIQKHDAVVVYEKVNVAPLCYNLHGSLFVCIRTDMCVSSLGYDVSSARGRGRLRLRAREDPRAIAPRCGAVK